VVGALEAVVDVFVFMVLLDTERAVGADRVLELVELVVLAALDEVEVEVEEVEAVVFVLEDTLELEADDELDVFDESEPPTTLMLLYVPE